MKLRLVIIYILVCFALGLQAGFKGKKAVREFKEGWNSVSDKEVDSNVLFVDVYLKPDTAQMPTDSLYNKKSQSWMPAQIQSAAVKVAGKEMSIPTLLKGIAKVLLIIAVMFLFLRLIVGVGVSKVFEWSNVKILRLMGLGLVLVFGIDFMDYYYNVNQLRDMIEIPGYRVIGDNIFGFMNLVLGLSSFLIAEVFAIGLKMREEQDLTI